MDAGKEAMSAIPVEHPVEKMPRVSIGLPVFNGGQLLSEAIESLLNQTYTNLELILSDNASTDETAAICHSHAAQDPRVRYYRNPVNRGSAWNHSRTVDLATGSLFKWAGADDLYDPSYLERCVAVMQGVPQAVLVYSKTIMLDDDGTIVSDYDDNFHLANVSPQKRLLRVLEQSNKEPLNPSLGLVRTAAMRRAMPLGSYYASDRVLLAQLAVEGEFHEVPERLIFRRVFTHGNYWTAGSDEEVAAWFDPAAKGRVSLPRIRKALGYCNAIRRSQQSTSVKLHCYNTLTQFYLSIPRLQGAAYEARTLRRTASAFITGHK